jgi:hypothetical protein
MWREEPTWQMGQNPPLAFIWSVEGVFPYLHTRKLFRRAVSWDHEQGFGSGFNQVSGSGSGSRRAKWPTKVEKIKKFQVLKCWMLSFRAEDFFCNLDVIYGGLRIGKFSVADPDPGSGAFLTPPDPGSRIPDPKPIYLRAYWKFFG